MRLDLTRLRTLRTRSSREIRVRGRQELAKLGGRLFGASGREMSDRAFVRAFASDGGPRSAEAIAAQTLDRITGPATSPLRALARTTEIAAIMARRFPEDRDAVLDRARRAIEGRFDLLAYEDLRVGTPIDWLSEPISGRRAPLGHWSTLDELDPLVGGDKKMTWELNRHQHFVALGQAYVMTGDERFAEAFVAQATSWLDANPPERGINWVSSLELAFRSISWVWALALFARSDRLAPVFVVRMLKSLATHGRHVERHLSEFFSPNTHLTGEALGLVYVGLALPPSPRADRWAETGARILVEQLSTQVRPDGVYFEQSSAYHRYTTDFYLHLSALASASGSTLSLQVRRGLTALVDHLAWITRPDRTTPLVGDDDGGRLLALGSRRPGDFRDTLAAGAALVDRPDWKYVAGPAPSELLWLLGPEAVDRYDALPATPPAGRARAFDDGGCYVIRDGWAEASSFVLFDGGPHGSIGGGHAHADALSFELAAGGRTWLVDPGTFTYTGDARERDAFRSTSSHNTATVDGEPQSVPAGPFSWTSTANGTADVFVDEPAFAYVRGAHDGYARLADPVAHERELFFAREDRERAVPSYLIVNDRFSARARHTYALRFHAAPGSRALATDDAVVLKATDGATLRLVALSCSAVATRVERGWVSRGYGHREPAPVAVFETDAVGNEQIVTAVVPAVPGEQPARVEPAGLAGFAISSRGVRDLVAAGGGEVASAGERIVAYGDFAWSRSIDGQVVAACLLGGSYLEIAGVVALRTPEVAWCALAFGTDAIEISVRGADSFELTFPGPAPAVTAGGVTWSLGRDQRRAGFSKDDAGWVPVLRPGAVAANG